VRGNDHGTTTGPRKSLTINELRIYKATEAASLLDFAWRNSTFQIVWPLQC
jgi:hypothetical protein